MVGCGFHFQSAELLGGQALQEIEGETLLERPAVLDGVGRGSGIEGDNKTHEVLLGSRE